MTPTTPSGWPTFRNLSPRLASSISKTIHERSPTSENITLASDVDGWDENQDLVSIMTLHAAKGLEFPAVFVLAMEQGILPHERSMAKNDELEEERRLAFVGITRAKEELYLTHCKMREFRGQTNYAVPSMFLEELPSNDVEEKDMTHRAMSGPRAGQERRGSTTSASYGDDTGFRDPNPKPRVEP